MSTITLPNIRVSSDLTVGVVLKDGGVAIDWSTLSNIKAYLYADAQRAMAGRCSVSVDEEDATRLVCSYRANKPQYIGVNRIVITCTYRGETKTFDKPALNFVRWTDDQAGQQITIDDPDVDVEIEVEDVSSSILEQAIAAALQAAADAEHAAHLIPNQVLLDCEQATSDANAAAAAANAAGITSVQVSVEDNEPGTPSAECSLANKVLSIIFHYLKGETGDAAGFGTISASFVEDGGDPSVLVTTSGPDTAKNIAFTLKNFKGDKGDKGDQGNTGSSVDYPFELVNNETTDDATKAHTAAGAKRLKDEVSQLEHKVDELEFDIRNFSATDCTTGGYYDTSGTYAPTTITTASNFITIRIPVLKGDTIHLLTKGGNVGRAYALTDANRLIYAVAPALADYTAGTDLVATKDGWLYVSNQTTNTIFSIQIKRNKIEKLEENVQTLDEIVGELIENNAVKTNYTAADCVSGYYTTSGTYASNTLTAASNLQSIKLPVLKGDRIYLKDKGGNNGRAYALTGIDFLIYDVAPTSADYSDGVELRAEKDGWLYVTNMVAYTGFELTILTNAVTQLKEDVTRIDTEVAEILANETETTTYTDSDCIQGAFYNTSGNSAAVTPTELAGFNTIRVQVEKGNKIHLVCSGGNAGRAYALTDETLLIYSVAPALADYSAGIDLTATKDGWLYVTNRPNLATLSLSVSYYKINRVEDLAKGTKSPMSLSLIETMGVCGASYCNGAIFNGSTFIGEKQNISWGKILGRMCGIDVSIFAQGGSTTETWQTRQPCLPALLAADPLDMYILQLGTNDATYLQLGTIADIHDSDPSLNPNTYYGNWGKIIEQIKAHAPKAKIVMSKILTNYPSAAYNWSSEAIEEIADHYSIPYIETMDSDFLKSPWLNTNIAENGGHPTALGYSGIAKAMKDLLEDVLEKYDTYFLDYAN